MLGTPKRAKFRLLASGNQRWTDGDKWKNGWGTNAGKVYEWAAFDRTGRTPVLWVSPCPGGTFNSAEPEDVEPIDPTARAMFEELKVASAIRRLEGS